ncbi:MAG TPA: hypothetical protein DCF91_01390 [Porphyromonadaceae bacterium]|nr:hypothetical protein [Porphyromonadaceae bacterium]
MILSNLLIKDQDFKSKPTILIEAFKCRSQGIAYMEQKAAILFSHRDQKIHYYNYDPDLHVVFGSKAEEMNDITSFFSEEDVHIINQYIKVINSYMLERTEKKDRLICFSIVGSISMVSFDNGYVVKIYPQIYDRNGCLISTLCFIERTNYIGKPILLLDKVIENKTYIYSRIYRRFVKENKQDLTSDDINILRFSGEGKKEQEIAIELGVTLANLKRQKVALMDKIQVKTLAEAIYYAYKKGLI